MIELKGLVKNYIAGFWIALLFILYGYIEWDAYKIGKGHPTYWLALWVFFFGLLLVIPLFSEDMKDLIFISSLGCLMIPIEDWGYWLADGHLLPQWYAGTYKPYDFIPSSIFGFPWFYFFFIMLWAIIGLSWLVLESRKTRWDFPLTNGDPRT